MDRMVCLDPSPKQDIGNACRVIAPPLRAIIQGYRTALTSAPPNEPSPMELRIFFISSASLKVSVGIQNG